MVRRTAIEKIAGRYDYLTGQASDLFRLYLNERAAAARCDGRAWMRAPLPSWTAYKGLQSEIGRTCSAFERLTQRRWEFRVGGINDPCWRL